MHLILFGSPGVGKGTQAKILASKLGIPHISTGDILREVINKNHPVGLKAKEIVNKGELIPDEIMIEIIRNYLSTPSLQKGFILDGFPRTINQAKELDKIFNTMSFNNSVVLVITARQDQIIKRLTNRRTCKNCNTVFKYEDIKNKMECPNCGEKNSFYQREDDQEEVIRKRLNIFDKNTKPVADYYTKQHKTIYIDGSGSIEKVTKDILKVLREKIDIKINSSV